MASKTSRLELTKPANSEFENEWDVPINENWDKIDTAIKNLQDEITAARGNKANLDTRLDNGLDEDGNLLATPEVEKGRHSPVSGQYASLALRINAFDLDVGALRAREISLLDGMAFRGQDFMLDLAIDGPKDGAGRPNFITHSGDIVTIDGTPTPVLLNCKGYLQKCRIDKNVTISGSPGTKYIYAEYNSTGREVENGTDGSAGGGSLNEFNSATGQFVTKDVKVGDLLVISSGPNVGTFAIKTIVDNNNIEIQGKFAQTSGSITFSIKDMLHPNFNFESTYTPGLGKCYVGECYFDGIGITSSHAYAFRGKYESDYEAIDVSSIPTFEKVLNHNLGIIPRRLEIYACVSASIDVDHVPLSMSKISHNFVFNFDDNGTGASLVVTGGVFPINSVIVKLTRNTITIKNARESLFYNDYVGIDKNTGYLKVFIGR
jgi:hypothetical protein